MPPSFRLGFQSGFYEEHYARVAFKRMNLFLLNDKYISFLLHLYPNCLTIYIPFKTNGGTGCGRIVYGWLSKDTNVGWGKEELKLCFPIICYSNNQREGFVKNYLNFFFVIYDSRLNKVIIQLSSHIVHSLLQITFTHGCKHQTFTG